MISAAPCIILAGGLGTRLRSAVPDRPKCLAPVAGKTFLERQLDMLREAGMGPFFISAGHMGTLVAESAKDLAGRFAVEVLIEPRPLGTGGAILYVMNARDLEEAVVINGDTFLTGSISGLLGPLALADREGVRMALVNVPDRARYGGVETDADGNVVGFAEKGVHGPGWINAGLYRVRRSAFDEYAPGDAFSLEEKVLPRLVRARGIRAEKLAAHFIDIGVPDDYRSFCNQIAAV